MSYASSYLIGWSRRTDAPAGRSRSGPRLTPCKSGGTFHNLLNAFGCTRFRLFGSCRRDVRRKGGALMGDRSVSQFAPEDVKAVTRVATEYFQSWFAQDGGR